MGLNEKRAQNEIKENEFPKWKESLNTITGFDIDLQVDWDVLLDDEFAPSAKNYYGVYIKPLEGAFKHICQDDMGKEALKGGLNLVKITNEAKAGDTKNISFADGVLNIDHSPSINPGYYGDRQKHLIKILSDKL